MTHDEIDPIDPVGDPACWLSRVCPACGAIASEGQSDHCRMPNPVPADCMRLAPDDRIRR